MNQRLRFVVPGSGGGHPPAVAVQLYAAATIGISVAFAVASLPGAGGHRALAALLAGLSLDPAVFGAAQWSGLATHWLLQPTLTELVVVLLVLSTAGMWLEQRLGTARFVALFALSGIWSGSAALLAGAGPVAGGLGPALGVLGAAIALDARPNLVGALRARTVWAALAVAVLALAAALHLGQVPFAHVAVTAALPVTTVACAWPALRRRRAAHRYRADGVAELQAEHAVRDQVEVLLEQIAAQGMESLSRRDRRFLAKASRFYSGGRTPDAPAIVPAPQRVRGRADSDSP